MDGMMNFLGCSKKDVDVHHQHQHEEEVNMNGDDMYKNDSCSSRRSWESRGEKEESKWVERMLRECARAISEGESGRVQQLLWMLNELSSPYGDRQQKLASYFLQALFCKATHSTTGPSSYRTLSTSTSTSFDSARRLILKFQEVSPWTTFGHVASNGAILEALDGHPKLHIIDIISNTLSLCTQWPTLLEALATRNDDTPHLKLTLLLLTGGGVMREVRQRMEKFARLMGVPFHLNIIISSSSGGLNQLLTKEGLGVEEGEALAVNCVGALRRVRVEGRGGVIAMLRSLHPKVVTLVEEEAHICTNNNNDDFVNAFDECLRFFSLYFDTLEESFGPTSNERLMLERECARGILRVLACTNKHEEEEDEQECWERGRQWGERMKQEFLPLPFSDDVLDDVKALLKRYRPGWSLSPPDTDGIYLHWKDEPVVWASAWKP